MRGIQCKMRAVESGRRRRDSWRLPDETRGIGETKRGERLRSRGSALAERSSVVRARRYLIVLSVSEILCSTPDTQAIIVVSELPSMESCSIRVSFESRYGTCSRALTGSATAKINLLPACLAQADTHRPR